MPLLGVGINWFEIISQKRPGTFQFLPLWAGGCATTLKICIGPLGLRGHKTLSESGERLWRCDCGRITGESDGDVGNGTTPDHERGHSVHPFQV